MILGIFGTFDVENYGDLLFPIIAKRELQERLGDVTVIPYSYFNKNASDWPYEVKTLAELDQDWSKLDGIIIGGGHIIRFDQEISPGYFPTKPEWMAHPESYWLSPALAAIRKGIPVCWNAPSASLETPPWAHELLGNALSNSNYVSIRDEATASELLRTTTNTTFNIVPDSVFGIDRLYSLTDGDDEASKPKKPYIIIQTTPRIKGLIAQIKASGISEQYDIYFLPISVCLGDDVHSILDEWPNAVGVNPMPDVEAMVSLISASAGVVAASLHLSITALAYGVPVLRDITSAKGKFALLKESPRVFWSSEPNDHAFQCFINALGTRSKCSLARSAAVKLKTHWDQMASIFERSRNLGQKQPNAAFEAVNRQILLIKKHEEDLRLQSLEHAEKLRQIEELCHERATALEEKLQGAFLVIEKLKRAVESAQQWQQRSWVKRAFHRWRSPVSISRVGKSN